MAKSYEWLNITWEKEDYLPAAYYKRLLKRYEIDGKEDVGIFGEYLKGISPPKNTLELGCGTGRATDYMQKAFPNARHTILDLSKTMIATVKEKYGVNNTQYVCDDSLRFMSECKDVYDFVVSLWSFSHSVHQTMERLYDDGKDFSSIKSTLRKFLTTNIEAGGQFYLIHFDSQSDEQRILLKQWSRVHPIYADYAEPSRSFKIITETLKEMTQEGLLRYSVEHFVGDPIPYEDEEEALEIFINFHLEGSLQGYPKMGEVIDEMSEYFSHHVNEDGKIAIRPAWYVIKIDL